MTNSRLFTVRTSLIVALGGFLMGFDASVISGVIRFIEPEFNLSKLQLGWAVSSLTLTSTLAMMVAGPLSTAFGRRIVLKWAALFYALSAMASAVAPDFTTLVIARMLGGLGVGASLIIAPMYIAEISPANLRGRMVSFNQLNIVLGISAAFFTNYLILRWSQMNASWIDWLMINQYQWRWMLGLETLPAVLYFGFLFMVPESPRWLLMKHRDAEALATLRMVSSEETAMADMKAVKQNLAQGSREEKAPLKALFKPALQLVLLIGVIMAIVQQITGINSVFFYAPMIFEQSGIGADASFSQAILVGLTNVVFTILAMLLIDRFGRKILLMAGLSGIAISMMVLSWGFYSANYHLTPEKVALLPSTINREHLAALVGQTFSNDVAFKQAIAQNFGEDEAKVVDNDLINAAITMNSWLVLIGVVGFVASFAVSLGPVMWVLFSEIFPNNIRGTAISFVGFINSGISFTVQLVFPWQLAVLGNALTFMIYGLFALAGLALLAWLLPETKNRSLEDLEKLLIKK